MRFAHEGAGVVLGMAVMLSGCSNDDQVRLNRNLQRQVTEANQQAEQAREEVRQLHAKREQDRRALEARRQSAAADADAAMTVTMATSAAFIILLLIRARSACRKGYAHPVITAGPKVAVPVAEPLLMPVQHQHQLPAAVSADCPSVSIPVHMTSQRRCKMLCLTRHVGEVLCIGKDVRVQVLGFSGSQIRIGVMAPAEVSVDRLEVRQRKLDARRRPNGGRWR